MHGSRPAIPVVGLAAAALAGTLALAACGSAKDEARDDSDVAYQLDEGGTTGLVGPDGDASVESGTNLEPDLPQGVALYPGAKVESVSNVGLGGSGAGALVTMTTADSPEKLVRWYEAEAAKQGFSVEAKLQTGALHMISGRAGDGRQFSVTATAREGATSVQLIAGSELEE